ncbi:MAG TPA: hypothetical protein PLL10_08915, partial [Elusimicrobiales bacterium]|nr:hypothetical protein [Elusimicrobiales bacterium]
MSEDLRLGEALVKNGVINDEKFFRVQKFQQDNNCGLGEAVVRLGFATEEAVAIVYSKLLGVPYASRENKILNPEKNQNLEKLIEEKFARENMLIPLFIENRSIAVAMVDPTNLMVLDNLRLMTSMEIQPFLATKAQVLKVIDSFYQVSDLIEQAMSVEDDKESAESDVAVVSSDGKLNLDKDVVGESRGAQSIRVVNAILKQAIAER